jgi:hypothetical protein
MSVRKRGREYRRERVSDQRNWIATFVLVLSNQSSNDLCGATLSLYPRAITVTSKPHHRSSPGLAPVGHASFVRRSQPTRIVVWRRAAPYWGVVTMALWWFVFI